MRDRPKDGPMGMPEQVSSCNLSQNGSKGMYRWNPLFDGKNPLVSFRFVFSPLENTSIESHSSWSQLKPTEWWSRHICQVLRHFFRIQCKGGGGTVPRECLGWQWCLSPPPNIWKKHVNTWKNRQFFQIFGQVGHFGDLFPAATNYELFWPWSLKAAGWNCALN